MTFSIYQCACPSAISVLLKDYEQKIYSLPICPLDIGKYIVIKSGPKFMVLSDPCFFFSFLCVCVSLFYFFYNARGWGIEPRSSNV